MTKSKELVVRVNKAGERRLTCSRQDAVSEALNGCNGIDDIAALAKKFGITEEEIKTRLTTAPNFGHFRMVVGNRMRSIANRLEKAQHDGVKLSVTDAAYPKKAKQLAKEKKADAKSNASTKPVRKVAAVAKPKTDVKPADSKSAAPVRRRIVRPAGKGVQK